MDSEEAEIARDVVGYLKSHQEKLLLRFVTVGSVDDGKSTLIGRLLHDAHGVYEDQLCAVKGASARGSVEIDYSLFTDGLKAEREQGITIDVAYRYFSTRRRKFIIADTPGHVQYTRNMATGASTADVALILIDARLGVLTQSRRHAYIASLLGIPHLAVCVNKMDLVEFSESRFREICAEFSAFASDLGFKGLHFMPVSALGGDNVVHRSERAPWYTGPSLLELLETIEPEQGTASLPWRLPVQTVLRPNLDYRGFAGAIAAGTVKKGDRVVALPSRKSSVVTAIDTFDGELDEAFAPMSVTLRLADEIDVSRGDMLVRENELPRIVQRFDAMIVWMNERALDPGRSYLVKHSTSLSRISVERVQWLKDLESLEQRPADTLALNDIGRVTLVSHRALFVDAYRACRATGAFILIDSITNDTVAAGMVLAAEGDERGATIDLDRSQVSDLERARRLGQTGRAFVVDGPASLIFAVERVAFDRGRYATVLEATDAARAGAAVSALVRAGLWVIVHGPESRSACAGLESTAVTHVSLGELGADPERAAKAAIGSA